VLTYATGYSGTSPISAFAHDDFLLFDRRLIAFIVDPFELTIRNERTNANYHGVLALVSLTLTGICVSSKRDIMYQFSFNSWITNIMKHPLTLIVTISVLVKATVATFCLQRIAPFIDTI
jgi:hypothetical protein